MTIPSLLAPLLLTAALLSCFTRVNAQDAVALHGVTIHGNGDVTVVYSKNFATCAHMRFADATCTQVGSLTHVQNIFCTQGNMVSVTLPPTAFVAGFGPGIPVLLVHGNNSGVRSACVNVLCDGVYGAGCAGALGVPRLSTPNACPTAGTTMDLSVTNGPVHTLAAFGLGFGQGSAPLLGCTLLVASLQATIFVVLDGSGASSLPAVLPPGSAGVSFTAQGFVLDGSGPQGFTATNGVLVQVM